MSNANLSPEQQTQMRERAFEMLDTAVTRAFKTDEFINRLGDAISERLEGKLPTAQPDHSFSLQQVLGTVDNYFNEILSRTNNPAPITALQNGLTTYLRSNLVSGDVTVVTDPADELEVEFLQAVENPDDLAVYIESADHPINPNQVTFLSAEEGESLPEHVIQVILRDKHLQRGPGAFHGVIRINRLTQA